MSYQGLRWMKCDLHMHNPLDNNWDDYHGTTQEAAQKFARACYEEKIDVIGLASHSYMGLQFYPQLKNALKELKRETGHSITMFPGFEITLPSGLGVHYVCLFDPNIDNIEHVLTSLGADTKLIGSKKPIEIYRQLETTLKDVQNKYNGIVIAAHGLEHRGILNSNSYPEKFAKKDFCNPDLLATEIPEIVSNLPLGYQKLLKAGDDCEREWRRKYPIATIMASDCKKFNKKDKVTDEPLPNSIGYRYTWIKMSSPSIESLKQAFLDHEGRIMLCNDSPEALVSHPHIVSIKIENSKFLEDQEVIFSPHLNCIIGGRGTGKSSLLECLRLAFKKDSAKDLEGDDKTLERIDRIKKTLQHDFGSGKVTVRFQRDAGEPEVIIWENGESHSKEAQKNEEVFFNSIPASFFSQQQLTHMTAAEKYSDNKQQAQKLLKFIDGFFPDKMRELERDELARKTLVFDAFSEQRTIKVLEHEYNELEQEHIMIVKKCESRQELQEPAKKYQLYKQEEQLLKEMQEHSFKNFEDNIYEQINITQVQPNEIESVDNNAEFPHYDYIQNAQIYFCELKENLVKDIYKLFLKFHANVSEYMNSQESQHVKDEINDSRKEFEHKLSEKGLAAEDIERLHSFLKEKDELEEKMRIRKEHLNKKKEDANQPEEVLESLYQIWHEQFMLRAEAVSVANAYATQGNYASKVIEVNVSYQGDHKDFIEKWDKNSPKRSTVLGKIWDDIGNRIFADFQTQKCDFNKIIKDDKHAEEKLRKYESPWQLVQSGLLDQNNAYLARWIERKEPDLPNLFRGHFEELAETWQHLICSRINDNIDLTLYRANGSIAGEISKNTLSDGQRNTAALVLLLAQSSNGPLIIDQPEEELDSEFIYTELLPLVQQKKKSRQLIFATHNANLPVNGDSELVYAFEARENKGKCLAQGGLDSKPVADAVLKIMEGSADAFKRRKNKYHF